MWKPFGFILPQKFLGVDVGTSSVKIVEVSKAGNRKKLENYGEVAASVFYEKPFRTFQKSTLLLSDEEIAKGIKGIIEEAGIKTKDAVFSIPDFSSFFTSFRLPPMTKKELPQAIKYEARQHIPIPLAEVSLDWKIIESKAIDKDKISFKVLLVAVPNEVINQYQKIAKISGLNIFALEAEVFSLIRALVEKGDKKTTAVIDIGVQSTTCSIVDNEILKMSHSFEMSDNNLNSVLSKSLNVNLVEAEKVKKEHGLKNSEDNKVREILSPLVDIILSEVKDILRSFNLQEKKEVEKIIIAGGAASTPGLKEYFQNFFQKKEIVIGNPFLNMAYSPVLKDTLYEIAPSFAIAVGAGLRGLHE